MSKGVAWLHSIRSARARRETPTTSGSSARAQAGSREALESLIRRHQPWIYNIVLRMLYWPHEAEDTTQEILIKLITKLATFQGRSSFRTWLYRIVVNHVLNQQRRGWENRLTFSEYGHGLDNTPDLDLPDPNSVPVELTLMVEEAKIGCTSGMLLCLNREQRVIYIMVRPKPDTTYVDGS